MTFDGTKRRDRILVSIAVSKPDGDLDALPGAINSAKRMALWAEASGYIPVIINDEHVPVTTDLLRDNISEAIEEVVNRTRLRRLVIFFAGHGASLGIDDQYWILSNWNKRPTEAVKVSSLQRMLEYYGPEQLTIIGDACQEFSARFMEVLGSAILDRPDENPQRYEIDRFFPVDAGSQAFMIKATEGEEAFCLFTEVMLKALQGDAPEKYFENINGKSHITSQSLANYLKENVTIEAGKYGEHMVPLLQPGFYTDRVYHSAPVLTPRPYTRSRSGSQSVRGPQLNKMGRTIGWASVTRAVPEVELTVASKTPETTAHVEKTLQMRRANELAYGATITAAAKNNIEIGETLNIRCGVFISGAKIDKVYTSRGTLTKDGPSSNWLNLELGDERDMSLWADMVFETGDGSLATACIVQNFVTMMHLFEHGATNVFHSMKPFNGSELEDFIPLLAKLQSDTLSEREIIDAAASMRWRKHQIITIGAIVAQFYDSIRDRESLRSIAAFYAQQQQPIPLDIILFGGGRLFAKDGFLRADVPATPIRAPRSEVERDRSYTFAETSEVIDHPVAGRVPWMRQAWGAIETAECDESAEEWRRLALQTLPHLGQGPFSMVKAEGKAALLALAGIANDSNDTISIEVRN